ncbi:DUF2493 domain-containing protein [Rhizobium leguminosarum]|uniref:DUF2493 domain-containing protein n=1 Tax=Rhizobium leguminosarum TaxID=384 RepID=UPI001C906FA4|nr:DUF2493 domain-containing protein [Rhizobium leguminosarum]MBY2918899.1 DUF2493 domain-containing protein [Rhizobium leguminosarum]MBY2974506.1 DUF2493 domain-containing protein [Rhizobium leguminosarum]MBY2982029.1 DUF2493 domain-containing protein [Rhizobium leguminosarum]MBY3010455.1 DUF2493 domain-containing protein [Rhizobium leguminosarum]
MMKRIVVCGGREYDHTARLNAVLDQVFEKLAGDMVIVTGSQRKWVEAERRFIGADYHAEEWARSREVEYMGFPARWKNLGKKAGYERNTRMYRTSLPNGCIAFPGGAGTRMMCGIMVEYGITPWCIDWSYEPKPVALGLDQLLPPLQGEGHT